MSDKASKTYVDNHTIGQTPLVELYGLSSNDKVRIFAKLEGNNPTGSHKDRLVQYILSKAQEHGDLNGVQTLVEASSGNTASSVAYMARKYGFDAVLFVPETTSPTKIFMTEQLGARVVKVSENTPFEGCVNYMDAAKAYAAECSSRYHINQYDNPWNSEAHYHGLGDEIANELGESIDFAVICASSFGTAAGVGKKLHEVNPNVQIVVADPVGSIYYPGFYRVNDYNLKKSKIEGAGKSAFTKNTDLSVIDRVEQFTDRQAIEMVSRLSREFGLIVGGSSGANAFIAERIASEQTEPKIIVTVFADTGLKYAEQYSNQGFLNSLENG